MPRKPLPVPSEADLAVHVARVPGAMLVDVVVLTADQELFQSAREAVGEQNPVWRARSADEAADLLITGRCGVLVIDMAAVSTRGDTLIEQIVEQFPDVIVCVAGTRADEPLLAPLISAGLVYRFMHKPTSARRAGMFLQAAIRRHVERRVGREASDPLAPLLRGLRRPTAGMPRGYLALIGLVALALVVPLFVGGEPDAPEATTVAAAPVTRVPENAATGRADPVLSRARAALHAGRLETPEGRNALDLFQAVLLAQPEHAEAQASLARTVDLLLQRAQQEFDAGHKPEAERLVQRVLAVVPDDPQAQILARRISPPDTPSRQLSREQRAEVEARLAGNAIDSAGSAHAPADARRNPGRTRLAAGTRHETIRYVRCLDGRCAEDAGSGRTARSARAALRQSDADDHPRSAQLRARAGQRTADRGSDRPDGAARACRACSRTGESQRPPRRVRSTRCAGFATSACAPRARSASHSPFAPSASPCTRYVCGLPPTLACQRSRSS